MNDYNNSLYYVRNGEITILSYIKTGYNERKNKRFEVK